LASQHRLDAAEIPADWPREKRRLAPQGLARPLPTRRR